MSWAVIVNNVAALEILMDCGYVRAGVLVGIGAALRWVVADSVVREAGLGSGWDADESLVSVFERWVRGVIGVG